MDAPLRHLQVSAYNFPPGSTRLLLCYLFPPLHNRGIFTGGPTIWPPQHFQSTKGGQTPQGTQHYFNTAKLTPSTESPLSPVSPHCCARNTPFCCGSLYAPSPQPPARRFSRTSKSRSRRCTMPHSPPGAPVTSLSKLEGALNSLLVCLQSSLRAAAPLGLPHPKKPPTAPPPVRRAASPPQGAPLGQRRSLQSPAPQACVRKG